MSGLSAAWAELPVTGIYFGLPESLNTRSLRKSPAPSEAGHQRSTAARARPRCGRTEKRQARRAHVTLLFAKLDVVQFGRRHFHGAAKVSLLGGRHPLPRVAQAMHGRLL